jgi:hypothetical protein
MPCRSRTRCSHIRHIVSHAEAGSEQRADPSVDDDGAGDRREDAGENAQQRGFARPICANHDDARAMLKRQADVAQGMKHRPLSAVAAEARALQRR